MNCSFPQWTLLLLAFYAHALAQPEPPATRQNADQSALSANARALVSDAWNGTSAQRGLAIMSNPAEKPVSRAAAMQVLHANRRKMMPAEMRELLTGAVKLAKDSSLDETNAAFAVAVMANTAITLKEQGQLSEAESKQEATFLITAANDARRHVLLRGSAITALGVLKVAEARESLREMLTNAVTRDTAELARPACLSLMRIDGSRAIPDLAHVLRETRESRVFGTAAFALGQLKSRESMAALVEQLGRFPDSGACGAALVEMEDTITGVLQNPKDEHLTAAIHASRQLWREGQRETCAPLLRRLVSTAPVPARKVAVERLIESASVLEFESEKRELSLLAEAIVGQPELQEYQERIQRRLSAVVAVPEAGTGVEVPIVLKKGAGK